MKYRRFVWTISTTGDQSWMRRSGVDFCVRGEGTAYSTSLMSGSESLVSAADPDFVATGWKPQKNVKKGQMFKITF